MAHRKTCAQSAIVWEHTSAKKIQPKFCKISKARNNWTRQSCELMHTKYADVHRSGACTAQCHNHSVAYFVDNGSGQVYGNFKFEPIPKLAAFAPMQLSSYVRHWWHLWVANKRTTSNVHFCKWSYVCIIWLMLPPEVMIESYASFQYDIPTCALYGWGPGRQVQAFIWERGQKVGTSGYQDWILKAIAQKITTDAGGSIGKPQQQSLRVDLLMMTMTQKKLLCQKTGRWWWWYLGDSAKSQLDWWRWCCCEQCHWLTDSVSHRASH